EDGCGGGIYAGDYDAEPTLINTIVSFNYSSFDSNFCGLYSGNNNIIGLDPGFVAAPLFDESGTLVNLNEIDLTLTASSYAIDHGTNDSVETDTDLAGNPRTFAAWKVTPTVDIGAYEYQQGVEKGETETPSTVVTTPLDILDEFDGLVSLREAISYAETGGTITFDTSLANKTITLAGAELTIDKSLTIDASSIGGISIDGNGKSRIIFINGESGDVTVELTALSIKNGCGENGGGIFNDEGTLKISNSAVSGNHASWRGGGISNDGALTLINTVISGNSAGSHGGGIFNDGDLIVTNTTVSGNYVLSEYGDGGGISSYNNDCTMTLTNSIVSFNYAAFNSAVEDNDISGSYSGSNNIICLDPGFVVAPVFKWGKIANFAEMDLSLIDGARAVNAGANDAVETEFDIAGNPRIVDGTVDIGAYEFQGNNETPSTVVTTLSDVVDVTDHLISLREAISYAESGDTVTFDASLAGKTITLGGSELEISKGMTIDASPIGGITVNAGGASRVFSVTGGDSSRSVELIGLTISGGNADLGGGIFNSGSLKLTGSTVTNNSSTRYGGGIYNSGALKFTRCFVTNNSSVRYGGGIANTKSLTVIDSVISANSASSSYGGGIFNTDTLTLTGSTVSGNSAKTGGGIYRSSGTIELTNTIVSFNYAPSNNDFRGTYTGSHNIVGDNPGFAAAPVFADGVLTNPDTLDLSLAAGSAAINAGTNAAVTTETDVAGNPRIVDGTVDIGAYEFQRNNETPSTVVTTLSDVVDVTDGLISLREAISYAESGGTVTFDASLAGGTITLNGTELEITKGMTIDAASIGGMTINADGKSRVFSVTVRDSSRSVELIGLTVTGGNFSNGSGIYNHGTLTITNST
ncbi:MAG: hypothetical protein J6S40_09920, partial [Thermoguttaceae bacterium]|nr:hypothetical protein [Thermoguttaceae bacterium]